MKELRSSADISRGKSYIAGTRLPFVTASVLPALLGTAWCWAYGEAFSPGRAFVGVLGVFFLHLGANTLNDYFDWNESDRINRFVTPFSGGSRSRLEHILTRKAFLSMSILFFFLSLIAGGVLILMNRPLVLLIGLLGGLCGILYSLKPFSLQSRGIGEFVIFLAFGPLITLGIGYVNFGIFLPEYFIIGIPNGLVVTNILWINEFPDYEADKKAGKLNLVVRLGTDRARYGYIALKALFYLSTLMIIIGGLFPLWSLLVFMIVPLGIKTSKQMWPI